MARYRDPSSIERPQAFRRKVDAERYLADQEASKARGDWIDPALGHIPLKDFYAAWRARADRLSPTTLDKYDRAWRLDMAPPTRSSCAA